MIFLGQYLLEMVGHTLRHIDSLQIIIKARPCNLCHARGEGDACQGKASIEGFSGNPCHALGDGNACQTVATKESPIAYRVYRIGDFNASKAEAELKCRLLYFCN